MNNLRSNKRELEKEKEKELKRIGKGGFRKRYHKQVNWLVGKKTALVAHDHKSISLRDLSLKILWTDRQINFQNTIKILDSKIHNHTTGPLV